MSTSLWHRFPARDFHALHGALSRLATMDALLSPAERERVSQCARDVTEGFHAKADLGVDAAFLILCVEFILVALPDQGHHDQLHQVLKQLRHTVARRETTESHPGGVA